MSLASTPIWLKSWLWGLCLQRPMLGDLLALRVRFSPKAIAYVMALGSDILLSALSG